MTRGPYLIAAATVLTPAAWAIHLAIDPDPFAADSAAVIAAGLAVFGLIAAAGLLLARGQWTRRLAFGVVIASLLLAVVTGPGAWYYIGLALGAAALAGLSGPWLKGWIRQLPGASGPPPAAMTLALGSLALVPAVGVASPSGLEAAHGVLGGAGLLLGWAYSRAQLWALWALRLALPVVAIPALFVSPWPGAVLLGLVVGALTVLAWTKDARLAVDPLLDRLPGPRVASPKDAP